MRLETGERRAFTLLEILLALALIALLATVFIGASSALLSDKPLSPDDQFWRVVSQSRKSALENERDVLVSIDPKTRSFVLNDGTASQSIPITGPRDLVAEFLSTQTDASAILLGGNLVETATLPSVTFFSDGTCSPFRVQFRVSGGSHVLSIDPWTCAPMLSTADDKA